MQDEPKKQRVTRRVFHVEPTNTGSRLDRELTRSLGDLPRERFKELVQDGHVRINGEVAARPSVKVKGGQKIEVEMIERDRTRPGCVDGVEHTILHEEETFLVVYKPPGMIVHPSETVRGGTLSERLAEKYPGLPSPQGEDRPGIVHRLDSETSGVLVVARTEEAGVELKRQFADREVQKVYCAIVYGEPRFDSDWLEQPLGRGRQSERISVVPVSEGGREASTFYRTIERLGRASYVECEPRTGRTHQIRVHFEYMGNPVVGDRLYRGKRVLRLAGGKFKVARHLLHAFRLTFSHPVTGERVSFEAPLPEDMQQTLEILRKEAAEED
ncbi:MAG: 23S rRNA pseudouridine1911/1915/1917 synthase [Gammaproteobacteria bacterium]|jgi:23S rRNA pseudouridine1911/1915/1917 synthase